MINSIACCTFLTFALISGGIFAFLAARERQMLFRQRLAQVVESEPSAAVEDVREETTPAGRDLVRQVRQRLGRETRRRRFAMQIPDALLLISSALRSGYSPARAIQIVAEEMTSPLADEFRTALSEVQLGLPPVTALVHIAERVRSRDWDLVVTAVTTQVQTGGNLAEILERIAGIIRERVRVQAETDSLTAEGRLSAAILVLLPPVLALLLSLRDPHYFYPLVAAPFGHILIGGAIAGQIIGTLILRRLLSLDV
jgi:tight adherence protein B